MLVMTRAAFHKAL